MFTVAVVTGTRAEYGLLRPVIQNMIDSKVLKVQLLVTGTHLSQEFGYTVSEIEDDGFPIAAKLDILSQEVPQTRQGTAKLVELALKMFTDWLAECERAPDAVLILGDRYEAFAAGQAASLLDIPVVHISGGDVTQGADDDWFRHCLTKMAKLHFPSCESYRQRILRMGEEPWRVYNVGGLGDENVRNLQLMNRKQLVDSLDFKLAEKYALVTLHPQTLSEHPPARQAGMLLSALDTRPDLFYLITGANADAGGQEVNRLFTAFCKQRNNAAIVSNLGVVRYLSAMKYSTLVIGNSSSGVVETPSLGVPCVDIGDRQAGRVRADNIVHCDMNTASIEKAMAHALQPNFAKIAATVDSPYNGGDTSGKIVEILTKFLQKDLLSKMKVFYDGEDKG